jgi:SAM-dependent methyltransferase
MAPVYDALTADHDYELWLDSLLPAAERFGLRGMRLLDVACGTGKSFLPLLERGGWEITGCDISESMLRLAREKTGQAVRLERADMRRLPSFGSFDLVLCLGDAVNYLLSADELTACLRGIRRNLAPGGIAVFDTNTLHAYRTFYVEPTEHEVGGRRLVWRGLASPSTPPGSLVEGRLEVEGEGPGECLAVHRQRHFRPREVVAALGRAGLAEVEVFGHGYDAVLEQPLDELRHTKAVFIAKADEPQEDRGR